MIHPIKIAHNDISSILAKGNQCPVSKKFFTIGDEVVICAKCKTVFLKDAWEAHGGVCPSGLGNGNTRCGCTDTLSYNSYSQKSIEQKIVNRKRSAFPILFPWIISIILGLIIYSNYEAFFKYKQGYLRTYSLEQENNNLKNQNSSLQSEVSSIPHYKERISSLENKLSTLNEEKSSLEVKLAGVDNDYSTAELKDKLNKYQSSIANFHKSPLIISSIDFKSQKSGNSKIYINYGENLYRSNIYYLFPRIKYHGFASKEIEIGVRIIRPNGSISRNGSSPQNLTYKETIKCYTGNNTIGLTGWGNESGGTYSSGWYTIEILFDNGIIGYKQIYINNY